MPVPKRWEGCEHVVECVACNGRGFEFAGIDLYVCPECQKRGVKWNRKTIPMNMSLRGYYVLGARCFYNGVVLTEAQVCANIWELDGPVVPWKPAPLHLLDGVPKCTSD